MLSCVGGEEEGEMRDQMTSPCKLVVINYIIFHQLILYRRHTHTQQKRDTSDGDDDDEGTFWLFMADDA